MTAYDWAGWIVIVASGIILFLAIVGMTALFLLVFG